MKKKIIGQKVIFYPELGSTQDEAKRLAGRVKEGTVIVAEKQTQGRGRRGHRWFSPSGGVYLSIIVKPRIEAQKMPFLTLLSAIAVTKSLRTFGLEPSIKWPNDVLVDGKKICGILTEVKADSAIIGIGLNVNTDISSLPSALKGKTTSIKEEVGKSLSRKIVTQRLLEEFEKKYLGFLGCRRTK